MISIKRTDNTDSDFKNLVAELDADLAIHDGDDHAFYAQFHKTDFIKYVVVAYEGERAIGCGAIKEYEPGTMEIKRMYTLPDIRGKGVASTVLKELEKWACELAYEKCILETGVKLHKAIVLYEKNGFTPIPNYGQFVGVEKSVCFEKVL